jgi:hypothetical protein
MCIWTPVARAIELKAGAWNLLWLSVVSGMAGVALHTGVEWPSLSLSGENIVVGLSGRKRKLLSNWIV